MPQISIPQQDVTFSQKGKWWLADYVATIDGVDGVMCRTVMGKKESLEAKMKYVVGKDAEAEIQGVDFDGAQKIKFPFVDNRGGTARGGSKPTNTSQPVKVSSGNITGTLSETWRPKPSLTEDEYVLFAGRMMRAATSFVVESIATCGKDIPAGSDVIGSIERLAVHLCMASGYNLDPTVAIKQAVAVEGVSNEKETGVPQSDPNSLLRAKRAIESANTEDDLRPVRKAIQDSDKLNPVDKKQLIQSLDEKVELLQTTI